MCAAVRSKHQNVTHFMLEVSNMFFSAEGKQAKEDDMLVSLRKKEKEKSFLYSQNHWTDTAVIKEDRTTKHILGLHLLTQTESLQVRTVLYKGQSLTCFLLVIYFNLLFMTNSPWLFWKLKILPGFSWPLLCCTFPTTLIADREKSVILEYFYSK